MTKNANLKDTQFVVELSQAQIERVAAVREFYSDNKSFSDFDTALATIVERGIRSVEHTVDHTKKAKSKNDTINALLRAASPDEIAAAIAKLRTK